MAATYDTDADYMTTRQGYFQHLTIIAMLLLAAASYWPGLSGPFTFDDYSNIVENKQLQLSAASPESFRQALLSGNAGPLKRPLSMISFALNRVSTGLDPFYFKLTNLAIHLFNGCLVYALCWQLMRLRIRIEPHDVYDARLIATIVAAVWLVHPAQLTSVLYVVQRMTSLSATFLFLGMLVYLSARARMLSKRPFSALLWVCVPALTALSCLAKENGALLFLFAFVVEVSLLRFATHTSAQSNALKCFFGLTVALPLVAAAGFFATHPGWLTDPHMTRPFTVIERLMTEARVMFLYVQILLVPSITSLALYYDDFRISHSLFDPPTTLLAIAALGGLLIAACVWRRKHPWFCFAVLWFLAAHLIESTVIMLELVHVHRNYVAYLGPLLAIAVTVSRLLGKESRKFIAPTAVLIVTVLCISTAQRAQQWSNPFEQAAFEARHRPNSSRANYELGRLYFVAAKTTRDEALRERARHYFEKAMMLDSLAINAPVALLIVRGGARVIKNDPAKELLQRRLSERPILPTNVHFLKSLVHCQKEKGCHRPPQDIMDIFGSALSQPLLRNDVKADLLAILGMYYANNLGDLEACIQMMDQAIQLVPDDPNHRLNLVHAFIAAKDFDRALTMLKAAEQRDRMGAYAARIREFRHDIDQLKKIEAGA